MQADPQSVEAQIEALEQELEELERSLPRHSAKPSHILRIEEIEEQLARLRAIRERDSDR